MRRLARNIVEGVCCVALRFALSVMYAPLKLLPSRQGKLFFVSRQSDTPPIDACLLFEELEERNACTEIVCICNRVQPGFGGAIRFFLDLTRSLYHLSTSRVCLLDSYWPAVSVLSHKRTLKVVQMWHSLGKVKQSGWQTVGKPGGRSKPVASLMKMHAGYDFVIAGGRAWNRFYRESFNIAEEVICNVGLPRIDYLLRERDSMRERVFARYPELREKPLVLYAPTFRRGLSFSDGRHVGNLLATLKEYSFNVVVKAHPNQPLDAEGGAFFVCEGFASADVLAAADYLITDYSAIALEGAVLNVKTLYYVPDYDEYRLENGLNLDLFEAMPGCVFVEAGELAAALCGTYPQASLDEYRKRYLPSSLGGSTKALADIVYAAGLFEANSVCKKAAAR